MRVGIGYDVHKLCEGRKLIIGGVEIPYELGLLGHSDADVLIHAIMDALAGAAKLGDIGKLFPDNDPKYKDISSVLLLKAVKQELDKRNYRVVNIDSIIVAQAPKMRPYIDKMESIIADTLEIPVDDICVKATTEEELGFTGRKEGISAKAVCLIEKKNG